MICPNCFHEQPDQSRECRRCGIAFASWGGEKGRAPAPGKRAAAPPRRARRGVRWYGIWLVVLTVLGGLGFLVLEPALRTLLRRGTVVFVSQRDGNPELYAMRSSGLEVQRLTSHPLADHSPSLSRDGRRVAFVSEREGNPEIYVVGSDGSGLKRLTSQPGADHSPTWAPDGEQIAFVSVPGAAEGQTEAARPDIYLVRPEGRQVVNLTVHPASDEAPAWSPGATQIAFVSDRDGDPEIYVMMADGSQARRLTHQRGAESSPSWSPDGSRIAFAAGGDLSTMKADGTEVKRVTAGQRGAGSFQAPVWSPDGRSIAAVWVRGRGEARDCELVVVEADGSGLERLGPAVPSSPAWASDSRSLAFVAAPAAGRRWFKARPLSGERQICLKRRGSHGFWARARNGARALALSALGGPRGLDSALEVLTDFGGDDPDWAPGGSEGLPGPWRRRS